MPTRYRVEYLDPHFAERFGELPTAAKRRVLELLGLIAGGQLGLGKRCGYQVQTGNLDDCRKVYFNVILAVNPTYRLIYRVLPNEQRPRTVEAITVGPKFTFDAAGNRDSIYVRAAELLDRI